MEKEPRKISRRNFIKGSLAVGGTVAVLGATEAFAILHDKNLLKDNNLAGKEIEEGELKDFVTDAAGDIDIIPVRSEPELSDSDIVGYTQPGFAFRAKAVYGVVYPSSQDSLGKFKKDGQFYGKWYEGEGLPLFDKMKSGDLVPRLDENGNQLRSGKVYVSGNFLKLDDTIESADAR